MPAPGNARGERMQHGYAPEGGKRITAHHCRVAKGVHGIIILLLFLGECWLRTILLPSLFLYGGKELWSFLQSPTLYKQESPKLLISLELNNSTFVSSCRVYFSKEARSCGVFYQPPVQADMLSACMEYEDILSDKQRGAHPSPFPSKARLPVAFPKGREPDTHPLFLGGCSAGYCGLKILILGSGG